MELIGLILLGGVVICTGLKLACFEDKKMLSIVIAVGAIAAGKVIAIQTANADNNVEVGCCQISTILVIAMM